MKVSDHHVRSPLLSVNRSCQTCHPVAEDELTARAVRIQENTARLRDRALDALVGLIEDLARAREAGSDAPQLDAARALQRRAQFYIDFIEAENSMGFHAPQEAARILGEAMDYARQGQIVLRDPVFRPSTP
jgi:nitrite reductase (cytochrome c-552)